jgi:tetratricopeptide (TPR) repeat protein
MRQIAGLLAVVVTTAHGAASQAGSSPEVMAHYRTAEQAMATHNLDEAAAHFREMLRLDPSVAEAHANLGAIHYIQRNYPEAANELRAALKLKPELPKAENLLALSLARSGSFREALPLLEKCFKGPRDEFHQETGLLLVQVSMALQRTETALDTLQALRKLYPENSEVLYSLYRLHSDLGAQALVELVRAAPESARLHQVAGELLEGERNYPVAIQQYERAIQKGGGVPGLHRALGMAVLNAAQDDTSLTRAQREFELELQTSPDDAYAEYELGEVHWRRNHMDEALRHFQRAAELHPDFTDALVAFGKARLLQGDAEARERPDLAGAQGAYGK